MVCSGRLVSRRCRRAVAPAEPGGVILDVEQDLGNRSAVGFDECERVGDLLVDRFPGLCVEVQQADNDWPWKEPPGRAGWWPVKGLLAHRGPGGETLGMPSTGGAQVVGRDGELDCLSDLAGEVEAGRGRLGLIEGEPGVGKTSLLRAFFENAAGPLFRRVTGAAEEFDQPLPFATVHSCLEPLASGDPQVAEVLALIRRAGAEYPVIESVLGLVEKWCADCPVAVAVDDLHGADPASLLLLHRLGRVGGQLPLLPVGVRRRGAGGRGRRGFPGGWGFCRRGRVSFCRSPRCLARPSRSPMWLRCWAAR